MAICVIDATQQRLPPALRDYLASDVATVWHTRYAKPCRDALAHRIPLYIPPAQMTSEEVQRYNELENEKAQCISAQDWGRVEEIWTEQSEIGIPCFTFLHAFTEDEPSNSVMLHPQLLSDAGLIAEFGLLFLEHWQNSA